MPLYKVCTPEGKEVFVTVEKKLLEEWEGTGGSPVPTEKLLPIIQYQAGVPELVTRAT